VNEPSAGEVTELLVGWNRGDEDALGKLLPIVYDELHRLASRYLRHERPEHILQSTALVHEAYLRLTDKKDVPWRNRSHFYAIAARMMRQVLVDSARRRDAAKRRGMKISLSETLPAEAVDPVDVISLNDALTALAALNARQARVVELRYFGGLTFEEVAEVLGIAIPTAKLDWTLAKAWLYKELTKAPASRGSL
jgi:RNA polymerase sigma factor (TIGR02999 family)